MISIDKVLLIIGVLLIISGSLIMLQGVRIDYTVEHISIPYYDFKYYGPGNYTETRYERLEFCKINDVQVSPNTSVDINCTDINSINKKLSSYMQCNFSSDIIIFVYAYSMNNEPFNLKISLQGCRNGVCDSIIDFTAKSKPSTGVIEQEYVIKKLVVPYSVQVEQGLNLDYEFFKTVLEADKAANIEELRIFVPAMCSILREINYPMLKVSTRTEYYTITSIRNIDTSGLIIGFILNTVGLTIMIAGIYLAQTRYSK